MDIEREVLDIRMIVEVRANKPTVPRLLVQSIASFMDSKIAAAFLDVITHVGRSTVAESFAADTHEDQGVELEDPVFVQELVLVIAFHSIEAIFVTKIFQCVDSIRDRVVPETSCASVEQYFLLSQDKRKREKKCHQEREMLREHIAQPAGRNLFVKRK